MVDIFQELQQELGDLLVEVEVVETNLQNHQNFQKEVLIMDLKFLEDLIMVVVMDPILLPDQQLLETLTPEVVEVVEEVLVLPLLDPQVVPVSSSSHILHKHFTNL
jgi:hypothetical protein